MRIKLILLLVIITSTLFEANGQIVYDTTITSEGQYRKLDFRVGNGTFKVFEIVDKDVDIRNGKIESMKTTTDTIAIKHNPTNGYFEIVLSDKVWTKSLFGKHCSHLSEDIEQFPNLLLERNKSTNSLTFRNPKLIGDFIKDNYLKRLNCIDDLDDQYMKKHVIDWITKIENDSINQFVLSFSSHFSHIHNLFELIVPLHESDSIFVDVSAINSKIPIEFSFRTNKKILSDSTIIYNYTDKVEESRSLTKQLVESIYESFEQYLSEDEQDINKIRLASARDEDKSEIELTKNGELYRYSRIMQSYVLDMNLEPRYSCYKYQIEQITTSNRVGGSAPK